MPKRSVTLFRNTHMATAAPLCVATGQTRLYAFQTTEREIVLGSAKPLARYLSAEVDRASDFRQRHKRTTDAIERFAEMADGMRLVRDTRSLYVLRRARTTEYFSLSEVGSAAIYAPSSTTVEAGKSLRRLIARGLRDEHASCLGGHAAFRGAVRAAVLQGGTAALEIATVAASEVASACRRRALSENEGSRFVCEYCAFSLVADYPSHAGVRGLLEIIETILQSSEGTLATRGTTMLDLAINVLARHFRDRRAAADGDPARDEFLFLLNRKEGLRISGESASQVLREIADVTLQRRWIEKGTERDYVDTWQELNSRFDEIAESVEGRDVAES